MVSSISDRPRATAPPEAMVKCTLINSIYEPYPLLMPTGYTGRRAVAPTPNSHLDGICQALIDPFGTNMTIAVRGTKYFPSARAATHGASAAQQTHNTTTMHHAPSLRPPHSKSGVPDSVRSVGTMCVDGRCDPFQARFDAWPAAPASWDAVFSMCSCEWDTSDPPG